MLKVRVLPILIIQDGLLKKPVKFKLKNELIKTLSNCSGHSGLAGGQYSDLTFENKIG